MRRFLISCGHALHGIGYGLKTQRHLRYHLLAACCAVGAGIWKKLAVAEWLVLLLLIAVIIAAELLNTAIEAVVDLVSPEFHLHAKAAKDAAAGAVLVLAMAALVIGAVLFLR